MMSEWQPVYGRFSAHDEAFLVRGTEVLATASRMRKWHPGTWRLLWITDSATPMRRPLSVLRRLRELRTTVCFSEEYVRELLEEAEGD